MWCLNHETKTNQLSFALNTSQKSQFETITTSVKEFSFLILFFIVSMVIFSTIMYFIERDFNEGFSSIPAACWWCVVTMTTVMEPVIKIDYKRILLSPFISRLRRRSANICRWKMRWQGSFIKKWPNDNLRTIDFRKQAPFAKPYFHQVLTSCHAQKILWQGFVCAMTGVICVALPVPRHGSKILWVCFFLSSELICIFNSLTLPGIMTKKMSILVSMKVAALSVTESAERSFASENKIENILTRSFASLSRFYSN